eukprot:3844086-Karenia_brevis.AAC.2
MGKWIRSEGGQSHPTYGYQKGVHDDGGGHMVVNYDVHGQGHGYGHGHALTMNMTISYHKNYHNHTMTVGP